MKKICRNVLVLVAALATFMLAACGSTGDSKSTEAQGDTRVITHDAGETTITGDPKRVVALEFSFVESLLQLGVTPVGIADDKKEDRITELAGKKIDYTSVGTRSEPNQEIIASLQPDLIIADTDRHSGIYEQLSQIAPTIVLNSREGSYQDMKDNMVTIADALGNKEAGVQAVADHEEKMASIASQLSPEESRTVQLVTARDELLRIHTDSSFVGSVIESLGIEVPDHSDEAYEDAGLERIAALNPDVLLLSSDVKNPITDTWKDNPLWENMTAVSTDEVHDVDRNLYTRFRGLQTAEKISQQVVDMLNAK